MRAGRKTTVSGTSHHGLGGLPVSIAAPLIATNDAMDASGIESNRLLYDDRPFERCRAASQKTQNGRRLTGFAVAGLDAWLHMRQDHRLMR